MYNRSLEAINRGTPVSIVWLWKKNIGGEYRLVPHIILGLPGESRDEMLGEANALLIPIHTVKFHQLQVVTGTAMANQYGLPRGVPSFEMRSTSTLWLTW